jgi:hypothetical protein
MLDTYGRTKLGLGALDLEGSMGDTPAIDRHCPGGTNE